MRKLPGLRTDLFSRRRFAKAGLAHGAGLALLAGVPLPLLAQPASGQRPRWAASWAAAPFDYVPAPLFPGLPALPPRPQRFDGQSLRQLMVSALGGERVRVRFSNLFGRQPLRIIEASAGLAAGSDTVAPATLQRLRFNGRSGITIAPGREAWSDPALLGIEPGQTVAVSYQVEPGTPFATVHPFGATLTMAGAAVMRANWRGAAPSPIAHIVTGLDVAAQATPRVIVAFGDSITQGTGNGEIAPASYPERLAQRLREHPGKHGGFCVVNAGIGGNRLLLEGTGPRGLDRFRRDALGQSGVTHVLILIGINDLGVSLPEAMQGLSPAFRPASTEQLAAGLQQLVGQAREQAVKVLLGTITPFKGAAYWSEEKELRRQALNRWIRGRQDVDAVVDFDRALRDAADPAAMNPQYDSGDHLHPGPPGYAAMGDAIDLRELSE
ncbi:GDSL-like Lipase/Acylhydrolase [Variovorax sp. PBL-H6]|uniref:SGNH/GDSL hydrolase family protein n=1 Tax=Variovorax sp. PBL-H6 TaxID=434009 RepID=UPI0013195C2E|nr:GDSL-type esterase/lipase family protein [Variovorax sp. PBL-H6]VTU16564.1 GDSL-like Lipase/Acylhydrolase [Variovorax sp. PBL-H6]